MLTKACDGTLVIRLLFKYLKKEKINMLQK